MKGSNILLECLVREGVSEVFGMPGPGVLPIYDGLARERRLRHILMRHIQDAAHAADGYARVLGKPGVCIVGAGSATTDLVTGLATANADSSPLVVIVGLMEAGGMGGDNCGDLDVIGLTLPVVKHSYLVHEAEEIAPCLRAAFHLARSGRPGAVLVAVPQEAQIAEAPFRWPETVSIRSYRSNYAGNRRQIRRAAALIREARRPLILAGRGVIAGRAFEQLVALAEATEAPVATTLLGVGCFPQHHPLYLGMVGVYGSPAANRALRQADLLLVVGTRISDRSTGDLAGLNQHLKVVHIDIDPAEIGKRMEAEVPLVGHVCQVLEALSAEPLEGEREDWLPEAVAAEPTPLPALESALTPQAAMGLIGQAAGPQKLIVADVGQHQMWAARYIPYEQANSFVTSGGLGTMGFALPAALGAKIACPERAVWAVVGDGGFQMTMRSLAVVAQERLRLVVCVINNSALGMVRQLQDRQFERRFYAVNLDNPDFVRLGEAYGLASYRAQTWGEAREAVARLAASPGAVLIEFVIHTEEMAEEGFAAKPRGRRAS